MKVSLTCTGGYDAREQENVGYHTELVQLAEKLGLKSATAKNGITALDTPDDIEVLFLLSVPSSLKATLLKTAKLLVYTPSNEHFGIVPLEAMLAEVPVLASNTGGPLETVVEGKTGWLRDVTNTTAWTEVMNTVLTGLSANELGTMGKTGRRRVETEFSKAKMGKVLDTEIQDLVKRPRVETLELRSILFWLLTTTGLFTALSVLIFLPD